MAKARRRRHIEQWFDRRLRKFLLLPPRPDVAPAPASRGVIAAEAKTASSDRGLRR
jgi:hypothetical protein